MVEIPLFPLPMVMFPQVIVPLHIFEERYKLLINRSIDESLPFGIVLNAPGSAIESELTISRVGVAVRVVQFERIENGRLNIMVAGEKRFEILQLSGNKPYWTASVEFLEDDGDDADDESVSRLQESFATVARLYRQAHTLASQIRGLAAEEIKIPDSPAALSYMVSHVLDISWEAKQKLLATITVADRLKSVAIHLEENIRRLQAQLARADLAGKMNGNGRHGKLQ